MKVRGSQVERPMEIDVASSPTTLYVRKNIHRVETEDFIGWEYEEETYPNTPRMVAWAIEQKEQYQQEMEQALTVLGVDVNG